MRAFLSHSSANKKIVQEVFESLGASNAEYDERTFAAGQFNVSLIFEALSRSNIFVLFATRESLQSGYVASEIAIANEFLASRQIARVLTFCLNEVKPEDLPPTLKIISAVRKVASVGSLARLIRSNLIELQIDRPEYSSTYFGRDVISRDIKAQLAAPDEYTPIAMAFSGVDGVGRRTLANKIISDVYPNTPVLHPAIVLPTNSDLVDIFYGLQENIGGLSKPEILASAMEFKSKSTDDRQSAIIDLIREINLANEILFIVDGGGVLDPDGAFSTDITKIIQGLRQHRAPLPYLCFVLFRTPPASVRERSDVLYFRVDAIETDEIKQLLSLHIKQKGGIARREDVEKLSELTDGHPYNIQFMMRLLDSRSIESIISDPDDLLAFKKRQGDEFISRIRLSSDDLTILSALKVLGQTSIEVLTAAVPLTVFELGAALSRLEDYHCIERTGSICSINRPLRAAFERSSRLKLTDAQVMKMQSDVIAVFETYRNEDEIDIEVISSAARAAASLGRDDTELNAFLSPSSAIFVARQFYDQRRFRQCAAACATALRTNKLISNAAKTEAVRLRCLSLARIGEDAEFDAALKLLGVESSREKAAKPFLEGFRWRVKGEPSKAVSLFKQSNDLEARSFSTLRELTHCLTQIGDVDEAEKYAKEAFRIAPTNPYIIDQYLSLRIAKKERVTADIVYDRDISDLLDVLERYGDEEGKSFFAIRMADIYRRSGLFADALVYAERATELTPNLVAAHLVEAEVLIKSGQLPAAKNKIEVIRKMVDDKHSGEGKAMLPEFLLLRVEYLMENGEIADATDLLKGSEHRFKKRVPEMKRKLSHQAKLEGTRLTKSQIAWLKV